LQSVMMATRTSFAAGAAKDTPAATDPAATSAARRRAGFHLGSFDFIFPPSLLNESHERPYSLVLSR